MTKILFINPPLLTLELYDPKNPNLKLPNLTAPYGILSLISYINKDSKKYEAQIIDCNKIILDNIKSLKSETEFNSNLIEQIKSCITAFKPQYIGISALFDTSRSHLPYIIAAIKESSPQCKIIVGGGLATNSYKQLLTELPEINALCYGEGEIPLKKLLDDEGAKDPSQLSSAWITPKSIKDNIIPQPDFVENLDEIPIVDFNYIDFKRYNNRSPLLTDTFGTKNTKIELSIHTSRGCPFNCVFCSNGKIHGKKIRSMSTEKVRDTIKHYVNDYHMNVLLIEDDNFLANRKRALEILKIIKDFNLKVDFPNGIAVYGINDDISQAFYETGVRVVPLAIESGSDYVLQQIINKPLRSEQIYNAVKSLKKVNIRAHAFIVIGLPGELDEHRKETRDMLIKCKIDWAYIFIAVPIAGSRLYEICERKGYFINKNYDNYNVTKCNIRAPGVDPEKIEKEAYYMNIVVNFIKNANYEGNNYDVCLPYFLHVVKNYPKHAIAHYMLAQIYLKTNQQELAKEHIIQYELGCKNPFWTEIIQKLTVEGFI